MLHGSPAIVLDQTINNLAQAIAQKLALKQALSNKNSIFYGKNLYLQNGLNIDGSVPVQSWYNKIQYYPKSYGTDGPSKATGEVDHFTQVIWKASTKLGCVAACTSKNDLYVVCKYSLQGNMVKYYHINVLPHK